MIKLLSIYYLSLVDHLRDVASGRVVPSTNFDYGSDFDLEEEEEEEEASKRSVSRFAQMSFGVFHLIV